MAYHQIPIITYQLIKSEIYCGIRLSVWNIISFGKQNFSHICGINIAPYFMTVGMTGPEMYVRPWALSENTY